MSVEVTISKSEKYSLIEIKGKILGDIDLAPINEKVHRHIETENANLLIDFSLLTHLNSLGINFFMRTLTKCRINQGDMIIFGLNQNINNIFQLTKLNEIYTIYSSKEEALNHFK